MAPNKFEKKIQQKFNKRVLLPNASTWNKLDAMLSVEEKPKKKISFFWMKIAASLLLFVTVGYYFYMQNQSVTPINEVPIIVENEEPLEEREKKQEAKMLVEKKEEREKKQEAKSIVLAETSIINNQKVAIEINTTENTAIVDSKNDNQKSPVKNKYTSAEKLLAELDGKTKKTEQLFPKNKIKVDANALLSEAETELDKTFKEKAIEKIKRNFIDLKTAVANRNYEEK